MGGYGICDRICLHIWQSAIIRPSIQSSHLSASTTYHISFCPRSAVPLYDLLVVGGNELTPSSSYSPYSPYPCIPVSPYSPYRFSLARFPFPVSHRRFPNSPRFGRAQLRTERTR